MPDKMIIDKMLRCTAKVCKYCQDLSYDEFCGSEMLIEACVFNLSQIGELTIKLRDECKAANPQVAWAQIYGLRNRIVHDYEGVNPRLIWEIISDDMPKLQRELSAIKKGLTRMNNGKTIPKKLTERGTSMGVAKPIKKEKP